MMVIIVKMAIVMRETMETEEMKGGRPSKMEEILHRIKERRTSLHDRNHSD